MSKFPKDFLWGVATSAAQVEGAASEDGRGPSIWDIFAKAPGAIHGGTTPEIACDTYHRYPQDIAMAKKLGVDSFRFSISWSRVLPEGKGAINPKGLDFYKRFIDELLQNDIVPNATVYHWDLPYELERMGGWCNREIVNWYGEYASLLFRELGDVVPIWSTINEPIATYVGYALGWFAPGRKSEREGRIANHNLLLAHGEGVRRFRQENIKNSKVGIVVDMWNHHPLRPDHQGDIALAELENEKTYRSYLNPIFKGEYSPALLKYMEENNCMPEILPGDLKQINEPLDYFGLNCYNRVLDCCEPELVKKEKEVKGGNYLDNGKEFYPKAIYDAIHILNDKYKIGIPIYVTENGTFNCSEEICEDGRIHDQQRIQYLEGFLSWIQKAIDEGADIRGYYLWSLLDNWEWCGGFNARYGLIHNDAQSQQRIWKDSAYWYQKFIADSRK